MSLRRRQGGLIPRGVAWVRGVAGATRPAPAPGAPATSGAEPEPEVTDRLELARRRLKQTIPPREP